MRRELVRFLRCRAARMRAMMRSWRTGRGQLRFIALEQSALRRVATLVARGATPAEVFEAVAGEAGRLLGADYTSLYRYEPDGTVSAITYWCAPGVPTVLTPLGGRWPMGTDTAVAAVLETGKPARRMSESIGGEIGAWARSHEIGHVVGCPIIVENHLWGVMVILFRGPDPPPEETEESMHGFVELTGCTIAHAESRAELIASRARIVTASDTARRRIERDLHDRAQQHLVALGFELREAQAIVRPDQEELRQRLCSTAQGLSDVLLELQEVSRGLHPAILTQRGLQAALKALAQRSPVPVELHADTGRLPEPIEVTAYYVVSEALTNVLKHAHASVVRVNVDVEDELVRVSVLDDGLGGAHPYHGSGLTGLMDRVEALGGTMQITSPAGEGTLLLTTIPLEPT